MNPSHTRISRQSGRASRRQLLAALVAAGGAVAAGWVLRHSFRGPDTNDILWQQALPTADGTQMRLSQLQGKPLIVNFWATWCAPCLREMPLLSDFYEAHRGEDLQVVGIAIDQASAVQHFLQTTPVSYPVVIATDSGLDLARKLGNTAGVLPYSVVWTANGKILAHHAGELQAEQLASWQRSFSRG